MSNLVPELRTNKNGFNAIKWVKPNGNSAAAATIPVTPPAAKPQVNEKDRELLAYLLTTRIDRVENSGENGGEDQRFGYDDLSERMEELDYETLVTVFKYMPTDPEEVPFVTDLLMGTDADERSIREAMAFKDCFGEYPQVEDCMNFTNGLRSYDAFGDDEDLSALTGDRMEAARSLCKVAFTVHTWLPSDKTPLSAWPSTQGNRHLTDPLIIQAIVDNPHSGDAIVELIQTRHEADGELIRQFAGNRTALAVGEL